MKKSLILWATILSAAMTLAQAPVAAQSNANGVTGAAVGIFPNGATFNGVPLKSLELGNGVFIPGDGSATGVFYVVLTGTSLLGQALEITVDGKVNSGSIQAGNATFSGIATLNMGAATAPLPEVPFTVTTTTQGIVLKLGSSTLPPAAISGGSITIK